MTLAHLHLLLNHLPILGIPFALYLDVAGRIRRSPDLRRQAIYVAMMAALAAIAAYLTGEPAEHWLLQFSGTEREAVHGMINTHEQAAVYALSFSLLSGALGLMRLILSRVRRSEKADRVVAVAFTFFLLFTSTTLLRTGWLGGLIRHDEIREGVRPSAPGVSSMDIPTGPMAKNR